MNKHVWEAYIGQRIHSMETHEGMITSIIMEDGRGVQFKMQNPVYFKCDINKIVSEGNPDGGRHFDAAVDRIIEHVDRRLTK